MSRVFKPKPKAPEVKVTSKRKRPDDDIPAPKAKDAGVTLVVDTPVKPRTGINTKSLSYSQATNRSQRTVGMTGSYSLPSLGHVGQDGDDDDDEWGLPSSPDILLLGGKGGGLGYSDGEDDQWGASDTPSKSKRPRAR